MTKNNTAGHIVNMNSILGHQVLNIPGLDGVYTASKFAVTALTETLRMELDNEKLPIKTTVSLIQNLTNIYNSLDSRALALVWSTLSL